MSIPFVAYVRNVKTDERTVVSSGSLWHMDTEKKIRWLFKPTEMGAFDSKEEFGIVKEDKIVFHHILLMAKDREELRDKLKSEKIRVVTRRSFFQPVEEPLTEYTFKEEKMSVQKKAAGKKTTRNVMAEDKIMKQFTKQHKQGKGTATTTVGTAEGAAATVTVATDEGAGTVTVATEEGAASGTKDPTAEQKQASLTPYRILEELWGDGKSSTPKPERRMKSVSVESLQTQLGASTEEISNLRKDVNALMEEHKSLQSYIRTKEEQFEGKLSNMTVLVKQLPDLIVQKMVDLKIQAPQECLLTADLQVQKEPEFDAVQVADDEWYLGAGFTLKRSIVKDIQAENLPKRYGRLTALFKAVYGQEAVRYSVSGESDAGDERHYNSLIDKKIPSCHYESFAKIMTFLEPPDSSGVIIPVTPKEVKSLLYKIPTDLRRRADREGETEEQKKMRLRIEREERNMKKLEKARMLKKPCAQPQSEPEKKKNPKIESPSQEQEKEAEKVGTEEDKTDTPTTVTPPNDEGNNVNDSLLNIIPDEDHE